MKHLQKNIKLKLLSYYYWSRDKEIKNKNSFHTGTLFDYYN